MGRRGGQHKLRHLMVMERYAILRERYTQPTRYPIYRVCSFCRSWIRDWPSGIAYHFSRFHKAVAVAVTREVVERLLEKRGMIPASEVDEVWPPDGGPPFPRVRIGNSEFYVVAEKAAQGGRSV